MSANRPSASAPAPERMNSLHDVVLNYLQTHAYASTARTLCEKHPAASSSGLGLSKGAATPTVSAGGMEVDGAEGDQDPTIGGDKTTPKASKGKGKEKSDAAGRVILDEDALLAIQRRQAILNYILNGAIMRAVEALNTHFPSVLDDSAPASSNPTSNGVSSNGTSDGLSGSLASLASRRVSNGWSGGIGGGTSSVWGSNGGLGNGASHSKSNSGSAFGNGTTNGTSNGSLSSDYALPVMHTSTHPAHVKLNLSIQAFIESFRQLAPASSPSTPSSSVGSLSGSMHLGGAAAATNAKSPTGAGSTSSGVTLTNALTAAQGLHQEAKKLAPEDRAVYLQEIKDVGALLAYTDPETSILKGFLQQGRRIALADQVNKAILRSEGRSTTSRLETYARRTSALWTIMAERGIEAQPAWTAADGHGMEQLSTFWKGQGKAGFKLHDFVSHSWA